MVSAIFVWMFFLCGVKAQVVFTVLPAIVEPGFTPSFKLSCSVPEQEAGQIVAISIFRQAITARRAKVSPKETIAELRGQAPGQVSVTPGYENVTAQGQLTLLEAEVAAPEVEMPVLEVVLTPQEAALAAYEAELAAMRAELGTYLEVTWPQPQIQDLGVYTCEVTIVGIAAGQTIFSQVQVTTSNLMTDRLLSVVQAIEAEADVLNQTLSGVQSEIDSITTALEEARKTGSLPITDKQTTIASSTSARVSTYETSTDLPATQPAAGTDLERLTVSLENLEVKFERFNETLRRLNKIVTILEERVDEAPVNETSDDQVILDAVRHFFTLGNSSYVLFQTNQNATADRAQAVCQSKRLHLAEIRSAEEFLNITDAIAPYLLSDGLVLVGGQKALGQDAWVFQKSQQLVPFFAFGPDEEGESSSNECLALAKSQAAWITVHVSCPSDHENLFFLCQQD